jgi:predicted RNA binding protein YcfA (HicA-like mRNA interferase family)
MRLPRDLSGQELVRILATVGYLPTRQSGSHVRLTTQARGEHHVTVPLHAALRVGTLAGVLAQVAEHLGLDRDDLVSRIVAGR